MTHAPADPLVTARPKPGPLLGGPSRQFGLAALVAALIVLAASAGLVGADGPAIGLALGGFGAAALVALAHLRRGYPHARLGLGNLVTLVRLALAAALLAPLAGAAAAWAVFATALVAFALDGLDGWLARRARQVSEFGARFDMEVDSALALILALNAWATGAAGGLVLLIALPRYAFAAAASALPWLDRPLPRRFGRKLVCVVQIAALILLQLSPLSPDLAGALILAVAAALAWSFGRDIWWLWRARP